jgi:hypothetical protein
MDGPLSEGARTLRSVMWSLIVLSLTALGLAFAGAKRWVAHDSIFLSLLLFAGSLLGAVYIGLKAHRRALDDRECASGQAMIITIAAQLGRQDEATLERIAARGGPAAEAARMILTGRRKERIRATATSPSTGT